MPTDEPIQDLGLDLGLDAPSEPVERIFPTEALEPDGLYVSLEDAEELIDLASLGVKVLSKRTELQGMARAEYIAGLKGGLSRLAIARDALKAKRAAKKRMSEADKTAKAIETFERTHEMGLLGMPKGAEARREYLELLTKGIKK